MNIDLEQLNWKLIAISAIAVIGILMFGVFAIQSAQDRAYALEEQVSKAKADISVQEKRRNDLVYNLADCVMQYSKYEAETLTGIAQGRGGIDGVSSKVAAIAEAYPELKSDSLYKELMNELSVTENLIAEYRSNYNQQVTAYNRYTRSFFNRIRFAFLGYVPIEYERIEYEATEDAPQNLFGTR